jgi:hypothetical protein
LLSENTDEPEEETSESATSEQEPAEESEEVTTEQISEQPQEIFESESPDVQEVETEPEPVSVPEETEEIQEERDTESKEISEGSTDNSSDQTKETENESGISHGDAADEVGDQGDPEGSLDSRALYGKQGGGDGATLLMTGWVWDYPPKPEDTYDETGRLIFEIVVDDMGDLISVKKIEGTVSPEVEKIYRREVEKLTFSATSDNSIPAPTSKGKITFLIRSR